MPATQAAADSCLSAPKGATPAGSHWYYRIDRVTKRQCWYLREESDIGRRQVRTRRAAGFGRRPRPQQNRRRRSNEPSHASRSPTRVPNGSPSNPAPSQIRPPKSSERRRPPPPHRSCRIARAQRCRTCWRRRRCRRCDGTTLPPRALWPIRPISRSPPPPPAGPPPQVEEVQQPAAVQFAPIAADAAPAKPTASLQKLLLVMAAALALAGLTVSAIVRIGRMRARRAMRRKRRAMWDSAKTKRRSPQPMFHDEDAGLRRTGGVHNPRVPQDRTRVPQRAYTRDLKSGHACPRSG